MLKILLCLLCAQDSPVLEPVTPATRVGGAPLWLFAVDDGAGAITLSAENTRDLLIGRLDRKNVAANWQSVAGSKDTDGMNIADHWHIFAHGHHWISFSTGTARKSFLLKLDKNLKRVGLWTVADGEKGISTNDHFLVAEPAGVAVGHFRPGYGHRVYRFGVDGKLKSKVDVGGGKFVHGNGSSAIPTKGGYLILATETLNMVEQGGLSLIETDANWVPKSSKLVVDEERANVAMGSGALLSDGTLILHARVRSGAYPRGEMPPPPPKGQKGLAPDDGAIVRYLIASTGKVLSREVLQDKGGNRPHTLLVGDQLFTTWDGEGTKLRIDRVK